MTFWQALKGWVRRIDLFDPDRDEFVGQLRDERAAAERSARASVRRRLDAGGNVLVERIRAAPTREDWP